MRRFPWWLLRRRKRREVKDLVETIARCEGLYFKYLIAKRNTASDIIARLMLDGESWDEFRLKDTLLLNTLKGYDEEMAFHYQQWHRHNAELVKLKAEAGVFK